MDAIACVYYMFKCLCQDWGRRVVLVPTQVKTMMHSFTAWLLCECIHATVHDALLYVWFKLLMEVLQTRRRVGGTRVGHVLARRFIGLTRSDVIGSCYDSKFDTGKDDTYIISRSLSLYVSNFN